MKTIKEIAEICGVSEQAVRGWCRRNNVAKDAKGSYEICESIESRIYQHYHVDVSQHVAKRAESCESTDTVNQAIIDLLRQEMNTKNEQLKAKDRLIEELRVENQRLSQELLSLSGKIGDTLQNLSQTQLADKMIEGKKLIDGTVVAPISEEQKAENPGKQKKGLFGWFRGNT